MLKFNALAYTSNDIPTTQSGKHLNSSLSFDNTNLTFNGTDNTILWHNISYNLEFEDDISLIEWTT